VWNKLRDTQKITIHHSQSYTENHIEKSGKSWVWERSECHDSRRSRSLVRISKKLVPREHCFLWRNPNWVEILSYSDSDKLINDGRQEITKMRNFSDEENSVSSAWPWSSGFSCSLYIYFPSRLVIFCAADTCSLLSFILIKKVSRLHPMKFFQRCQRLIKT
jgi:hypothetical protein